MWKRIFIFYTVSLVFFVSCRQELFLSGMRVYNDSIKIRKGLLILADTLEHSEEFRIFRNYKLDGDVMKIYAGHNLVKVYQYKRGHLIRIQTYDADKGYYLMWNLRGLNMQKPFTMRQDF